jgi:hypothetical protein
MLKLDVHLCRMVACNFYKVRDHNILSPLYRTSRAELNETVGGKLTEFIQQINSCYPPEIVEYYSPNYSKRLLEKIEDYGPST